MSHWLSPISCFYKYVSFLTTIAFFRGGIAYNVIDLDPSIHEDGVTLCLKDLQRKLTMQEGVLSTRILFGTPGIGYARNINGEYYV